MKDPIKNLSLKSDVDSCGEQVDLEQIWRKEGAAEKSDKKFDKIDSFCEAAEAAENSRAPST